MAKKKNYKKLPYFPFYYLDWLSSTSVQLMTYSEKGLYMDMICRCYNDDGLPSEIDQLLVLFHTDEFSIKKPLQMFYKDKKNLYQNEKLDAIKKDQREKQNGASKAGKASAKLRKSNKKKELSTATNVERTLNERTTEKKVSVVPTEQNRTEQNKTVYLKQFQELYSLFPDDKKRSFETELSKCKGNLENWEQFIGEILEQYKKFRGAGLIPWCDLTVWIKNREWEKAVPEPERKETPAEKAYREHCASMGITVK